MLAIARLAATLYGLLLTAGSPASAAEVPFNWGWQFHRIDDGAAPDVPPVKASWSTVSLPHTTRIEPRIVNKTARIIWAVPARGEGCRSPAAI